MTLRKTKIVCTIGPAVNSSTSVEGLLRAGMNVARFNFSHGDSTTHRTTMQLVRKASSTAGIPCALLADTKGPEIRTGEVKDGGTVRFQRGRTITLTTEQIPGTSAMLSISYQRLPQEVHIGTHLLIADGVIDLEVQNIDKNLIHCLIHSDGEIGAKKNVNVIGVKTSLPAVTEKDRIDLQLAVEEGVDFVAASFTRKPSDIREIRTAMEAHCRPGQQLPYIIAKIEDEEGLSNIDEIIRVSDGIMVARGDLGVQLPPQDIPLIQKRIIRKCNAANKVVIVATQMLDSMIRNPLPTRAEVADVANAMLDGADAVMLSGETAQGKYPIEAVSMMHAIAIETENSEYGHKNLLSCDNVHVNMSDAIARAAVLTAADINADALVSPTYGGNTPRLISRYRPFQPIIAVTPSEQVRRHLLLYWGVYPILAEEVSDAGTMVRHAINAAVEKDLLHSFDKIVLAAGVPVGSPIMLNTVSVHILADVIAMGTRGFGETVSGSVVKASTPQEALSLLKQDGSDILIAHYVDEQWFPVFKKIGGYVVEHFSSVSWESIFRENPKLVAIAGVPNLFNLLNDGERITLDGLEKLILRENM